MKLILVLFSLSAFAKQSPLYLDAEKVFSDLGARPAMQDSEWLNKVGDKKESTYTVKAGDNLWSISRKVLGDAFLWRKLWEVNAFLTNPHEIEPGTTLKYYNADRKPASNDINLPLTKLAPAKNGGVGLDSVLAQNIKNRFRPNAFVLTPEDTIYGEIKGSHRKAENLYVHESIYVKDYKGDMKPGDVYALVRDERDLRDRNATGVPNIGTVVRLVGEIKITELGEKFAKAEITSAFGLIQRGDKLVNVQKPVEWSTFQDPPDDMQARIVSGEEANMRHFGQGQLVMLDKGSDEGMKRGFSFRVWSDTDDFNQTTDDVDPESKGEVRVVSVSPLSSVGFVIRNNTPLEIGDWLIPRQSFKNPPNPPKKQSSKFEF